MVAGVRVARRCGCGRVVRAAAAALLLPALLLLLPPRVPTDTRPAPTDTRPTPIDTRPAPTDTRPTPTDTRPAPTTPSLGAAPLQLYNSSSLVGGTLPLPVDERMRDTDAEALPAGAGVVLVRQRYVAGHSRAHGSLCVARGARLRLVVLVASAPAHAPHRMAVRLTWGHAARRSDVALGFMLGAAPPALRAALDAEDALYGDLIEGRYRDTYWNLTLKTLSMLEWFVGHCPRAARLLKSDDDTFINVEELLRFAETPERRQATRTVWGKVGRASAPVRDLRSKFFVPLHEFPDALYPPYADGPAYLVSGDAADGLLRAALGARWLRMEDALVTGVAAARAGVARVDAPAFSLQPRDVASACALRAAISIHKVPYRTQFDLWRKLHDLTAKCA